MSHAHSHAHTHRGDTQRSSLKAALASTAGFMLVEFAGGLYTNSLALLADSGHMLTDVAALALSLFAAWFSTRRATPQKTFGFHRVEILVALLNGILLVAIAIAIFVESYERFANPPQIRAGWMIGIAAVGLIVNLVTALMLFEQHRHNLNIRGAFFHVLSDAAGSVGAIAAGIAILFWGYSLADPLISVIVGVLILSSSWLLIRDSVDVLLEAVPAHVNIVTLRDRLVAVDRVRSVHDLHVWTLTSGMLAMSCHVIVDSEAANREVLSALKSVAHAQFGIDHTTIQIEQAEESPAGMDACGCDFGGWDRA